MLVPHAKDKRRKEILEEIKTGKKIILQKKDNDKKDYK